VPLSLTFEPRQSGLSGSGIAGRYALRRRDGGEIDMALRVSECYDGAGLNRTCQHVTSL
jgi:hypothetical protein